MTQLTQLSNDILEANWYNFSRGNYAYYIHGRRNFAQHLDLADISCGSAIRRTLESGSSRDCMRALRNDDTKFTMHSKDITRSMVKTYLRRALGFDFSVDAHELSFSQKAILLKFAKMTRYVKPKSSQSSLSRASLFFVHLANKVN